MPDHDPRLKRLRDLAARLERLPESAHREWMLAEVRARMVDVDTGYPPRPLRPRREPDPPPERAPAARPRTKRPATARLQPPQDERVQPRPAPPPPPRAPDEPAERRAAVPRHGDGEANAFLVDAEQVLWLEDAEEDADGPPGSEPPRWRRGLPG